MTTTRRRADAVPGLPSEPPNADDRGLSRQQREGPARAAGRWAVGTDTWKTWARRRNGPDGFQWSDLLWGGQARLSYAWRQQTYSWRSGRPCPVCAEESPEPDAEGKRWQSLYCGCTVCSSCVRAWNATVLQGTASASAPSLSCPACSAPLTSVDTLNVLERNPEVGEMIEELSRDAALRMMPEWRSCPHCTGGGFTTSECLLVRYTAVDQQTPPEEEAHRAEPQLMTLLVVSLVIIYYLSGLILIALAAVAVATLAVLITCQARAPASRAPADKAPKPLEVGCPDCERKFSLPAHVEALAAAEAWADAETKKWISANTRPCPSCGTAIQKASGCNHMQCGACRVRFCWACMRASTNCAAFGCRNGAPYGNASQAGLVLRATPARVPPRVPGQERPRTPQPPQDTAAAPGRLRTVWGLLVFLSALVALVAALEWARRPPHHDSAIESLPLQLVLVQGLRNFALEVGGICQAVWPFILMILRPWAILCRFLLIFFLCLLICFLCLFGFLYLCIWLFIQEVTSNWNNRTTRA